MALYADGETQPRVGDMVVGKPCWTTEEQCGRLIALREAEESNAVVAYVDQVSLKGYDTAKKLHAIGESHFIMIRPFEKSPTVFLRMMFASCHTSTLTRISGPLYDILIDDQEFRVPYRMKVADVLALVKRDQRFVLYRKSDGIQDVRAEHDMTIDIQAGMEFYTTKES